MYVPVYSASKFRGLIIGTFEVDQLVDRQLKPILKDASFLLRTEDGTVFYKSGELANNPANLYSTTIRVAQTSWTVSWDQHEPSPEYLRYGRAIELVATVLLAALVLLILYLFQTSKIDTQQHTLQVFEQNCLRIEQQFNEKQQENAVLYRQLESTQGDLIRATKMATLGEMAAVLAHEIRNPLTAIINCLETLKRSNRNSENTTLFDMSMKEALRLEHIVSDCLNFARPKRPEIENVNLGAIVSEVVHAFRQDSRWRSRARVNFVDFEHDVTVRSDPEQLGQVLWNLLINSAQAIPKSGDIAIECFLDAEGTQASVQIRDSGEGMAPDTQARIFEPFFSTKHAGVGLGLFIVKRIIDDHDGSITVDSAVGRGTVVTIWLPVVKEIMHVALAGHR
jgi:signal transduction histidine kinase